MAQTNYTPIQLYYSTTASAVPIAGNLANGELAINITDGKIYYKNNSGVVTLFGSTGDLTSIAFGTTGLTPSAATGGAVTVAGTLVTANGGTGLSSFASGDIMYYSSGTLMSKLTIGTAGQILTVNSGATAPQWSTLTGVAVTTFSAGTTGFTPSTATSGAITLAGTLATTNGGTGLTSFTSGGAVYATSTSALTTGTLPVTAGGTGLTTLTAGYIPFGSGTSAFGSSANLFWDSTNFYLGIGTTAPRSQLDVYKATTGGNIRITSNTEAAYGELIFSSSNLTYAAYGASISSLGDGGGVDSGNLMFKVGQGSVRTEAARITGVGNLGVGTTTPTSLLQTAGTTSKSAFKTPNIAEVDTISATAATGTINFDITTQSVLFYTSNASANWTVNFRGSSGTSLNTVMQTGESISATFLVTQGATAYYNSAVTIDGTSVTPKWQGGTAPTSGNASSVDCYTYVIQKTGSATYVVLASQTKFA
jgi:hypothetical protein